MGGMIRHQPVRFGPDRSRSADAPAIEPLLVTAAEACRLLSISERQLRKLTTERRLPHVSFQSRTLYSVDALRAWVAALALGSLPTWTPDEAGA